MNEPDFETRQLTADDYEQVIQLIEDRFSLFFEYDKARHKSFIKLDQTGLPAFKARIMAALKITIRDRYLNAAEPNYRIFGTLDAGVLMSMVEMKIISPTEWVLDDLKARDVALSRTGLRETMTMLYQTARDLGLTVYYSQIAKYRYEKFQKFMLRLVPELYSEYQAEIIQEIPAGSRFNPTIPRRMMGRRSPLVDVVVKRMTRRT